MGIYRMEDGSVANTSLSTSSWKEESDHDGRNYLSRNTGSQWEHEQLYLSRRGRYYLVSWSDWQGSRETARYVSREEAAGWLCLNGHRLPADLADLVEQASE